MDLYQDEHIQIKKILKDSPHGMSVTEIARAIDKNKHSVGRYLDILHVSGQVEMRTYGKAKVFSLSSRIPINTMLGFASDLIIVLDREFRIVKINDSFLQLIKKTREEITGKNVLFLPIADPSVEPLIEKIKTSLNSGVFDPNAVIQIDVNHFYRQKIIPTVFDDGAQGMTIILEDISDQKIADRSLLASEERFRLMAENIRDGLIISENGKMVYANRRVEEIFGYPREELILLSPSDLAAPEEKERIESMIAQCGDSRDVPTDLTFWIVRKDGERRFIYNRITAIEHESTLIKYIVITDMTAGREMHDKLENQLGFLQHLIGTFPNPLFYIDVNSLFLGCNEAFATIVGKNSTELAGKIPGDVLSETQARIFMMYNGDLLAKPGIVTYKGSVPFADRSVHEITIQKSSYSYAEGKNTGIIGMIISDHPA